jgi:hypothetical protein
MLFDARRAQVVEEREREKEAERIEWDDILRVKKPMHLNGVDCGTSVKLVGLGASRTLDIKTIRANTQSP